jgi:tetratricopeptide (TPR) repeat protein
MVPLKSPAGLSRDIMASSSRSAFAASGRGRVWFAGMLLVLLAVAAHGRSVWSGFIWDDEQYVLENTTLRSLDGLRRIWLEPRSIPQYYPLVHTTFWLEYHLWGDRPMGYHVVNVALHAISCVLFWRVLVRLGLPAPWFAAALLAVHPVGVETVSWVTERKNTLSLVFALGSLWAWLESRGFTAESSGSERAASGWYWLSIGLFVAALLSKTVAAMLVPMLGVIEWWKTGRITPRTVSTLVPFVVVGLPLALFTVWLEKHHVGAFGSDFAFSPADRLLIAGRAACFYAAKLAWPHPLAFFYDRWTIDARQPWQWLFPLAVVATAAVAWWQHDRLGRGPLAVVLMFLSGLFPALGFFDVYPFKFAFVADHFTYHAAPVFYVAAASAITLASLRRGLDPVLPAAVVLAVLLPLAVARCASFRDCETLWLDTLAKTPNCSAAANNLGALYQLDGRLDEAVPLLKHAARTALFADARSQSRGNLAMIYLRQGRPADALPLAAEACRESAALIPQVAHALACIRTGRLADAERILAAATQKHLDSPEMKLAQAELALRSGDEATARTFFAECVSQDDTKTRNKALLEVGIVWLEQGHTKEAVELFDRIEADDKLAAKARLNLGVAHAKAGDFQAAVAAFREAVDGDPTSAEAHGNLGRALLASGDRAAALRHLERSRTLSTSSAPPNRVP